MSDENEDMTKYVSWSFPKDESEKRIMAIQVLGEKTVFKVDRYHIFHEFSRDDGIESFRTRSVIPFENMGSCTNNVCACWKEGIGGFSILYRDYSGRESEAIVSYDGLMIKDDYEKLETVEIMKRLSSMGDAIFDFLFP